MEGLRHKQKSDSIAPYIKRRKKQIPNANSKKDSRFIIKSVKNKEVISITKNNQVNREAI